MAAGLQCGSTIVKYLLFLFNFVFVLCGIALITVGALALKAQGVTAGGFTSALILIIAVGSIIFVVAFYGCCGSIRESHCMLITFAVFLLAIIVIEVVAVVLVFVNSGSTTVQDTLRNTFEKATKNNDQTARDAVFTIQTAFTCCGYTSSSEWTGVISPFPESCCKVNDSKDCSIDKSRSQGVTACKDTVQDFIEKFGKIAGGVGIVIAIVEVLGVWFALGLAGSIKNLERGRR